MLHTHLAAVALAATTLAASGCGGSSKTAASSSSASTTPATTATVATPPPTTTAAATVATGNPLTPAQWIAQGDAICARLNAQINAIRVRSSADLARALPQIAAYEQAGLTQLVKLVPPASRASDWKQYLTDLRQSAINSRKVAESAHGPQFTLSAPLVAATSRINEGLKAIAKRDGFKECSVT